MIAAPLISHALGIAGVPLVPAATCPGGSLDPVCGVVNSVGSSIASDGAGAVLGAITNWVVSGATWLLERIGDVLSATTSVDVGSGWFGTHFQLMVGLLGVVVLPMVLMSVIQAVYRQSLEMLVRSLLVHLPLALLLTGAALQIVQLGLAVTDDMSDYVASGTGTDLQHVMSGVVTALEAASAANGLPAFVLLLGALLVSMAAFMLWVELLVRAAAVYVAVLFLPLALASLVWPAISHWCRRLVETLAALILSKFVIVAILSLAAGALASGTSGGGDDGSGFASLLGGGALLLLAAFSPFALLRLVPMVEAGAVQQLEGARHRVQHAITAGPRAAMSVGTMARRFGMESVDGSVANAGPVGSSPPSSGGPPSTQTRTDTPEFYQEGATGISGAGASPGAGAGAGHDGDSWPAPIRGGGDGAAALQEHDDDDGVPAGRGWHRVGHDEEGLPQLQWIPDQRPAEPERSGGQRPGPAV